MMKKILAMCLILFFSTTIAMGYENIIKGIYSDVELVLDEKPVTRSDLDYQIINVNEHTYMAVRDIGKVLNMDVLWNENGKKITLKSGNDISIGKDAAMTIGKEIIQDAYQERLTDTTQYVISESIADCIGARPYFEIYVCFNPKHEITDLNEMIEVADVCVSFHEYLSDIGIKEMHQSDKG